ncbi:MAG: S26 family signal peptidase, partial [Gammaproteobacteria bacterium]|nr:S26 family signal peptidase [Gammaproteobacteria bacterium]
MSFNLALILTVLTAVSGAVVLWNRLYYAEKTESNGGHAIIDTIVEYSRSFFPVLLFVLVVRSFIFEPFRIPSGSMMPTLVDGDYIFVKKYSYGLRWPVIEKKFLETGEPER